MNKITLILLLLAACQPATDAINQSTTDLSIVNPVWTRSDPNHIYHEIEVSEHDFTIKNSSNRFAYNRIIIRASYFDRHHRLLYKQQFTVRQQIKPHESYRVKGTSGGVVRSGTESASVNIVNAAQELQPVDRGN